MARCGEFEETKYWVNFVPMRMRAVILVLSLGLSGLATALPREQLPPQPFRLGRRQSSEHPAASSDHAVSWIGGHPRQRKLLDLESECDAFKKALYEVRGRMHGPGIKV